MKKYNKVMSIFLSIIIILSVLTSFSINVGAAENSNGNIVGEYYVVGLLKAVDPLSNNIKVDSKKYQATDNFDFNEAVKYLVERPDCSVVCKIVDEKVSEIYSEDDICRVDVTATTNPKALYAKNGKLNVSEFTININISYIIDGSYGFIPENVLKNMSVICNGVNIKANSDALNFGSTGFWWFKDNISELNDNSCFSITAGTSIDKSYTVYVNDDYKLKSANSIMNLETTVSYENKQINDTAQITVGSIDIVKEKTDKQQTISENGKTVNRARQHVDQTAENALTFSGYIDGYLSLEQQKYIREVLYVWVADIFAALSSEYCEQNTKLQDLVYEKLGIDDSVLTSTFKTKAKFYFNVQTHIGKRTIEFELTLNNYSLGKKPSYAGFGNLNYKMYKKSDKNNIECQGTGMVSLTDMESFTQQLTKIANNQIKTIFKKTVGDDLDKIANYLTEGTMVEVLKNAGLLKGSFSDNIYNMLLSPTEHYLDLEVDCPVDVFIYNSDGDLVGRVVDNKIDTSYDEIYMFVSGEEKHIFLFDENYSVKIVGYDSGTMDYIVNEMSEDGSVVRKISYKNLNVVKGESYQAALPSASLQYPELYNPINAQGINVAPTNIDQIDLYNFKEDIEPWYSLKCGDNVYYERYENGFVRIYGEGAMHNYSLPDDKSPLTGAKYVMVDDGVTTVGDSAFTDSAVQYICIGNSVTSIGQYALYNCEKLKKITFGDSVNKIENWAFSYTNNISEFDVSENNQHYSSVDGVLFSKDKKELVKFTKPEATEYTIPDGVETIGIDAFGDYTNLKSITFPNSMTTIEDFAFDKCTNLENISIPDSVTYIGSNAFDKCTNLKNISIPDSVTYIGSNAFAGCKRFTDIIIPESLTYIGSFAFSNCTSLTTVNYNAVNCEKFSDKIYEGGYSFSPEHPFDGCTELKTINIGKKVETIPNCFLYGCDNITSIIIPNSVKKIGDYAFMHSSVENLEIPEFTTSIGDYAFAYSNFESSIPDSITYMGKGAFKECKKLVNVTIPKSVTSINGYTFYDCTNLERVIINKGVSTIDFQAFEGCSNLSSITVPDSITRIGVGAFEGCNNIKEIIIADGSQVVESQMIVSDTVETIVINDDVSECSVTAFESCYNLKNIEVSENNKNYSDIDGILFNKDKTEILCYPQSRENISYTIPSGVTKIGDGAFIACQYLNSVVISDSVITIDWNAFTSCKNLASINIGNNVEEIEDYAFANCTSLTSVTFPNSVKEIGCEAFSNCTNLKSVLIGDDINYLWYHAFYGCTNLLDVTILVNTIPDEGIFLYDDVFEDCPNLTIHGYKNSVVEEYANDNRLKFVALEETVPFGDANGDGLVNAKDRMLLTRYLAKWSGYEDINMTAADVNNDGAINAKDRMILTRHLAKWQGYETLSIL